ncbi:uncharacterized protein LOC133330073, partial [Musca vetustissima]|uniref:uncharacterized protein LOC133330073 n=1 Tax=Musca vetustissima TaxID=27455 RepID=UPI002AB67AEB
MIFFKILIFLLFIQSIKPNNVIIRKLQTEDVHKHEIRFQLKQLFYKVDRENRFDNCILIGREFTIKDVLVPEVLQKNMGKSVLIQTFVHQFCNACLKLNKNFLIFIYWQYGDEDKYVSFLSRVLQYKLQNRIILLAEHMSQAFASIVVWHMLRACSKQKIINVIVLLGNFYEDPVFYAFEMFPEFEVVTKSFGHDVGNNVEFFPNKMANLYGHKIRTYPDQMIPRSALHRNQYGQVVMKGYVVSFLEAFAQQINGSLSWPLFLQEDKPVFYQNIFDLAKADRFDIPAALVPALHANSSRIMSHLYEVRPWCIMVPIEKPHSYKEFIYRSMNLHFFLRFILSMLVLSIILELGTKVLHLQRNEQYSITLDKLILNTKVFRGIFGWSFKLQPRATKSLKILYTVLFVRGLLVTVQFSAILQSFLTHPLTVPITNFQELRAANLKVVIFKNDLDFIKQSRGYNYKRFLSGLEIYSDYEKYRRLHSSFNTSYAYPVHYAQWYIYSTQQRSFSKPLFRLSRICLPNMGITGFVLPQNSLYLQPLNKFIIRAKEFGFNEYWLRLSYIELKRI